MINKRLHDVSYSKEEYESAISIYNSALIDSGYNQVLSHEGNHKETEKRQRKRNIIWFNPPFNKSVIFLNLVKKHFPPHHKFNKIFNTNTIKLSYSCTTNMANNIKRHNNKILHGDTKNTSPMCNCRRKSSCPLNGNCQSKCLVYRADVSTSNDHRIYYGQCEGEFKARYNNHMKSFRNKAYINETELFKHIWMLKTNTIEHQIKWSIAARAPPYKAGSSRCTLCLTEKVAILRSNPRGLLNRRTELLSKCRHRNKYLLCNLK